MKVEPMTNAVVTAGTLQAFADQLPAWIDQRQHAAIGQLVEQLIPVIDRRAGDLIGRAIEQLVPIIDQRAADIARDLIDQRSANTDAAAVNEIAAQVAAQVAGDVARALVPADTGTAPVLDADRIRTEIVEAARTAIASALPALVEAANTPTISTVLRDRDGRITAVQSVPAEPNGQPRPRIRRRDP